MELVAGNEKGVGGADDTVPWYQHGMFYHPDLLGSYRCSSGDYMQHLADDVLTQQVSEHWPELTAAKSYNCILMDD